MKLYVLEIHWDYEGAECIGVFDTEAEAEKTGERLWKDPEGTKFWMAPADSFSVSELELNTIDKERFK